MKKTLTSIILSAVILLTACGCEDKTGAETTTTTAEVTTEAVTTEAITTTTEVTTAEAVTTTTTGAATTTMAEIDIGEDTGIESVEIIGTGLIQNGKKGDGFLTFDRSEISADLAASGMSEKKLTTEAVKADHELLGNNTENVYVFAMLSGDGAKEYPTSDSSIFMATLLLNEEAYSISFGTGDKVTAEEVVPYCSAGKYIEYWAFATVSDNGSIILLPFIAGSEDNGYYLVQPVMKMMNADVSDMVIPEPVGTDYDDSAADSTPAPETSVPSEGSAVLNITNVENYDGFTSASITMENKYSVPLIFTGKKMVINGVDHGVFTAFFEVPAGGTIEDYFWVDDYALAAGDQLEITFELQNSETFESFGEITFKMTLESTYISA